jgi:arylsulfate sulfotransferase
LKRLARKIRRLSLICSSLSVTLALSGCGSSGAFESPLEAPRIETSVAATSHPLVARFTVQVSTPVSVHVEFGPDIAYGRSTSAKEILQGGNSVEILVAGMKPATAYHMRAVVNSAGRTYTSPDQMFTTAQPPVEFIPQAVVTQSGTSSSGVELLNLTVPNGVYHAAVLDLDGSLLWYYAHDQSLGFPYPIRPMPNGNMLIVIGTQLMREVDLAGTTVRELTPQSVNESLASAGSPIRITGFHHEALPLENGKIIVLCEEQRNIVLSGNSIPTLIRGDVLIELDQDFHPAWTWTGFDHLDVNYHPMDIEDWTHGNGLLYSPEDGALLLSLRNVHWVVKINYRNGAGNGSVLWRLGPEGDIAILSGDEMDWFYGQHFPTFAEKENNRTRLAIFDNRATNQSGTTCATETDHCYSRAVIFEIDEGAKTASVVWENNLNLYSLWGGNIQAIGNQVEYLLSNPFPGLGSRISEVDRATKQPVWQMDIAGQLAYRAYRIPSLYPGVQW